MSDVSVTVKLSGSISGAQILPESTKRSMLTAIGQKLRQITLQNFGVAGLHRSAAWSGLTPRYMKRIKYYGPPKLTDKTGRLPLSIYYDNSSPDYVVVGTQVPFAAAHQFGAGSIPARPFFPLQPGATRYNQELTPYAMSECIKAAQQAI
jgi:phage gpG-like protein